MKYDHLKVTVLYPSIKRDKNWVLFKYYGKLVNR